MEEFSRIDTLAKVTGAAVYADDIRMPGMIYAATVHSSISYGRIRSIDPAEAAKIPGFLGIFTSRDIPGENCKPHDKPVLADGIVRSKGDGIAIVAAETMKAARKAASLVKVEYEEWKGIFDPESSLKHGARLLYEDGNTACEHKVTKGDVTDGFREADIVLERRYETNCIQHSAIENDSALAVPDQNGITIYCPCKFPYNIKKSLAAILNMDQSRVRVIQPAVGGSFGGKDIDTILAAARASVASLRFGRPCRMTWTREECICEGSKRHPFILYYKAGIKKDGRITALEIHGVADAGAYRTRSLAVIWRAAVEASGPYEIPNVLIHIQASYTNNVFADSVRGFGSPQVDFATESMMDELSELAGLSPLEFRRRNIVKEGSAAGTGQILTQVSIGECLDKLEETFPLKEPETMPDGRIRSRGIACLFRGESYGAASKDKDVATVDLHVQPDGSVNVLGSISEVGQGTHSVMTHVCSQILGIPDEQVVMNPVDTAYVPDCGATAGSRGTITGGNAAALAAEKMRDLIAKTAAEAKHIDSGKILFHDGSLFEGSERLMTFREAASLCFSEGVNMETSGEWKAPDTDWNFESGQGKTYYSFSYGAAGAEIEVDPVTGKVDVTDLVCLHDIGRIMNLPEAKGQINGGVVMALGQTLFENDNAKEGVMPCSNFDGYLLPTSMDLKRIRAVPLEIKPAENALGVHGVGEASTALVAPAVANALYRASGVRMRTLPFSLERVRKAFAERGEEK